MNRLETALDSVLGRLRPNIDFHALYPCTVKAQNADLSLELVPDNVKVPPHSKVKIRLGVPNMAVKVSAGARALLGFEEGNPGKPYVSLWESASVTELVLNGTVIKLNDGGTPVAKEGSLTVAHTHLGVAGPFPVVLQPNPGLAIAPLQGSQTVRVP